MMRLADNIPGKPHRWADAIGAWARGELVQWRYASTEATDADWRDCDYPSRGMPNWSYPGIEYRAALSSHHEDGGRADTSELEQMRERKDAAYLERNQVVAALAKCFPSGVARTAVEGWSEDWHGCVYIDLPTGQASWHFHDSHAYLFDSLPPYTGTWDGHDTPEKYARLAKLGVALGGEKGEPPCSEHPDAPHGYNRSASHNAGRYVCDCEGWAAMGGEKGEAVAGEKLNELLDAYAEIAHQNGVEFCAGNEGDLEGELTAKRAVLALFAAPVGAEWQPISTAPMDGTPIRLYAQGGGFYDEDFNPSGSVEGHCTDGTWYGAFWDPEHDTWCSREGIVPTHWMPLPKPPVVSSGDGGRNG